MHGRSENESLDDPGHTGFREFLMCITDQDRGTHCEMVVIALNESTARLKAIAANPGCSCRVLTEVFFCRDDIHEQPDSGR